MTPVLLVVVFVLVVAVGLLARSAQRYRRAYHRYRDYNEVGGGHGIRRVRVEEFDDAFHAGPFGPGTASEVTFSSRGTSGPTGSTSDFEGWILSVLAKRAHRMFEFGTCTGRTTYAWARNSPPDAKITTITLPPDGTAAYQRAAGDDDTATRYALEESAYTTFAYSGTDVASKVEQRFGDSKTFDEGPHAASLDLIFIDGSHAYSYVLSDSRKALRMIRPGGIILWHDYGGEDHIRDVHRALNELSKELDLVHIAGTTLVAYRAPLDGARRIAAPGAA
jgi:predicted O-methyltransferase YrrM